jgi:hypothetical protein
LKEGDYVKITEFEEDLNKGESINQYRIQVVVQGIWNERAYRTGG